jgi:predicted nuclease of predicted toxin-antitoxin system
MRFLADENFPRAAVTALRAAGHDVAWVSERSPGARDADVLHMAAAEARILLTFDKDFGELAWSADLPASCGVMLFRLPTPPADSVGDALRARIADRDDWAGHFSVIETGRVRMRPLNSSPES